MGFEPALVLAVLLFAVLIASAYTDIARGKVYNWITFPAMALALVLHIFVSVHTSDWFITVHSLVGLAVGVCIFLLPYRFGLLGGGDVKLMGAVGALQGANFVVASAFLTGITGAVFALAVLIWKGKLGPAVRNLGSAMFTPWKLKHREKADDTHLPYGLAIAVGSFWAWFLAAGVIG